jgi:hypothetical protein
VKKFPEARAGWQSKGREGDKLRVEELNKIKS